MYFMYGISAPGSDTLTFCQTACVQHGNLLFPADIPMQCEQRRQQCTLEDVKVIHWRLGLFSFVSYETSFNIDAPCYFWTSGVQIQ